MGHIKRWMRGARGVWQDLIDVRDGYLRDVDAAGCSPGRSYRRPYDIIDLT